MMVFVLVSALLAVSTSVAGGSYDPVAAALGDVPYLAAIYDVVDYPIAGVFKREYRCAGAILDNEHVVTTATCAQTTNFTGWMVVAPSLLNRSDSTALFHNVTSGSKLHLQFDYWTKDNDIAILKVEPPFVWTATLSAVEIRKTAAPSGASCRISGWRKDMVLVDAMLSYANATIFDQSACFYLFGREGMLCGGVPKDERYGCLLGDEGSPLVCDGLLTGLFHYNMNVCFDPPQPGVFTDIVYQKDWIEANKPSMIRKQTEK